MSPLEPSNTATVVGPEKCSTDEAQDKDFKNIIRDLKEDINKLFNKLCENTNKLWKK